MVYVAAAGDAAYAGACGARSRKNLGPSRFGRT